MKFEKCLAGFIMSFIVLTTMSAKAQFAMGGGFAANMGGTGMLMGQQACPYPVSAGAGASSYLDEYNEIKKALADEQKNLRDAKAAIRKLERSTEKSKNIINDMLNPKYSGMVTAHIENQRLCEDYNYDSNSGRVEKKKSKQRDDDEDDEEPLPAPASAQSNLTPISGFTPTQWGQYCTPGAKGGVNSLVCSTLPYVSSERGRYVTADCTGALESLRRDSAELQRNQREMTTAENLIARYKEDLPKALRDAKEDYKADRENRSEGGLCLECMANGNGYVTQNSGPNVFAAVANAVTGGIAYYGERERAKMIAEYNSDLGWPTQAYPSGAAYPYILNGLMALAGGTGSGAYGCGATVGGGGNMYGPQGAYGPFGGSPGFYGNAGANMPFGYPQGMNGSPYGGGMYNGGMGPFGINLGGGFNGGAGFGNGYGNGFGGNMGGQFGGNPNFGFGGAMGGYPGYYGAGGNGMFGNGNPFGFGGQLGGQFGGGFDPYGNMMGGGGPYGNMMGGLGPYGNMMGGNGMNQYGLGGNLQMQQAMMQMQMQQYQLAMQQQQQQMQNTMARQQAYVGLQMEMEKLRIRMQQIQMGGPIDNSYLGVNGGFNGSIGGSIGGGISIGGGSNIPGVIPAPGTSMGSGTNTIPTNVTIPAGSR